MAKVIGTPQLLLLCERATVRDFNRQANNAELRLRIDPNGRHVSVLHSMVNDNPALVRVSWMVKLKEDNEPHPLELDVELAMFNKLTEVELPAATGEDEDEETFA